MLISPYFLIPYDSQWALIGDESSPHHASLILSSCSLLALPSCYFSSCFRPKYYIALPCVLHVLSMTSQVSSQCPTDDPHAAVKMYLYCSLYFYYVTWSLHHHKSSFLSPYMSMYKSTFNALFRNVALHLGWEIGPSRQLRRRTYAQCMLRA
jgi:hypothetical protein